jgi:hypothetical protein
MGGALWLEKSPKSFQPQACSITCVRCQRATAGIPLRDPLGERLSPEHERHHGAAARRSVPPSADVA